MAIGTILIPVGLAVGLAVALGGKKKKKGGGAPAPIPEDEGEIYAFGLGDFGTEEGAVMEVAVLPGDAMRFDFETVPGPYSWYLFSEVVNGAPNLEVVEDFVPPAQGSPPGAPGHYIADIMVHPGAGSVALDFMLLEAENEPPLEHKKVLVLIA
jgi:hypothetical protein